jgi:hypothetical protein
VKKEAEALFILLNNFALGKIAQRAFNRVNCLANGKAPFWGRKMNY